MQSLKILFFVNGPEMSAIAERSREFSARLPSDWTIKICYRPEKKWKGIVPFIKSATEFKPDIIYVMDTAYTGVISGFISKLIRKCKLIIDTGDVTFELAKSTGNYSIIELFLINLVEQLAIYGSDYLIVRGSFHKEFLARKGIKKVEFIPDGINLSNIPIRDKYFLKQNFNLNNNLVVGIIGTMIWSQRHKMCYGWDIIEALSIVKDLPIKCILIGDGDGQIHLKNRVKQLGIQNKVDFIGKIPSSHLSKYLSIMDVCISTQSNDLVGNVRTTGKLPLYLAYGKYVIATDVGEARNILPGVGCLLPYEGIRDDNYPLRLANHLKLLIESPEILQSSRNSYVVAKSNFDYDFLTNKLQIIFRKICS